MTSCRQGKCRAHRRSDHIEGPRVVLENHHCLRMHQDKTHTAVAKRKLANCSPNTVYRHRPAGCQKTGEIFCWVHTRMQVPGAIGGFAMFARRKFDREHSVLLVVILSARLVHVLYRREQTKSIRTFWRIKGHISPSEAVKSTLAIPVRCRRRRVRVEISLSGPWKS